MDPNSYSKCYAMELDGFVSVSSTQDIQTTSTDNNTYQFANQFRYPGGQLHSLALPEVLGAPSSKASHSSNALAGKGIGGASGVTVMRLQRKLLS